MRVKIKLYVYIFIIIFASVLKFGNHSLITAGLSQRTSSVNDRLSAPMTFNYHETDPYARTGRHYILAESVITPETPERFQTFFKKLNRGLPPIYFNSPGGDLASGLRFGRIVRKLGLDTFVGGPYRSCFHIDQTGRESEIRNRDEKNDASDRFASDVFNGPGIDPPSITGDKYNIPLKVIV